MQRAFPALTLAVLLAAALYLLPFTWYQPKPHVFDISQLRTQHPQFHRFPNDNMSKQVDANELKQHKSEESAWVVIDGGVYDVTEFLEDHPGGKKILLKNCGKDASESFWTYHSEKVLAKTAKDMKIGEFKDSAKL